MKWDQSLYYLIVHTQMHKQYTRGWLSVGLLGLAYVS